jgi:hypothetical protein
MNSGKPTKKCEQCKEMVNKYSEETNEDTMLIL